MSPEVLLIVIAVVPIAAILLLRVNASLVFLSTCLGLVLLEFVGGEASTFADMFLPWLNGNNLKLALLLLPVVLTTVFMMKTVRGGGMLLNALPAVGTGLVLALLIVPLLPPELSNNVQSTLVWQQLDQVKELVVGASAMVCLFFLWTQRPKHAHGKHGHHGKHH